MIWLRRCLVLVPVLSFLAAALIMSCGGGSSGTTTPVSFEALIGLNVCDGAPPIPTPKPTATNGHIPTSTPTPICTPIALATSVGTAVGSNTVQFQAQGIFGFATDTTNPKYRDITNANNTQWNTIAPNANFPGVISYSSQGNGLWIGVQPGCTYFNVSAGGFSQNVLVGVVPYTSPCPSPPVASPAVAAKSSPTATKAAGSQP
jgi:hypothetical protein